MGALDKSWRYLLHNFVSRRCRGPSLAEQERAAQEREQEEEWRRSEVASAPVDLIWEDAL